MSRLRAIWACLTMRGGPRLIIGPEDMGFLLVATPNMQQWVWHMDTLNIRIGRYKVIVKGPNADALQN